eukprot:scaffold215988_cov28-Tisochrysis_lutea.AAC.1
MDRGVPRNQCVGTQLLAILTRKHERRPALSRGFGVRPDLDECADALVVPVLGRHHEGGRSVHIRCIK